MDCPLVGKRGVASTISAKVTAWVGGEKKVFINQFATGYLSSNEPRIHIGLGQNKKVDQLEVQWTGGEKEVYKKRGCG